MWVKKWLKSSLWLKQEPRLAYVSTVVEAHKSPVILQYEKNLIQVVFKRQKSSYLCLIQIMKFATIYIFKNPNNELFNTQIPDQQWLSLKKKNEMINAFGLMQFNQLKKNLFKFQVLWSLPWNVKLGIRVLFFSFSL